MNKSAKKLLSLMNTTATTNNKKSSASKQQAKNIIKTLPPTTVKTPAITIPTTIAIPPAVTVKSRSKVIETKCKYCKEFIYLDPNRTRLLRKSEKERLKRDSDTIMIPINKRDNRKHRCQLGLVPKERKCSNCGACVFFHRLYYDDLNGKFIALNSRTLREHHCKQDNEEEGIVIGAWRRSYHDGYEH